MTSYNVYISTLNKYSKPNFLRQFVKALSKKGLAPNEIVLVLNVFVYYDILITLPEIKKEWDSEIWTIETWDKTLAFLKLYNFNIETDVLTSIDRLLSSFLKIGVGQFKPVYSGSIKFTAISRSPLNKKAILLFKEIIVAIAQSLNIGIETKNLKNENGIPYAFFSLAEESHLHSYIQKTKALMNAKFLEERKIGKKTVVRKEHPNGYTYLESGSQFFLLNNLGVAYDSIAEMETAKAKIDKAEEVYDKLSYSEGKLFLGNKVMGEVEYLNDFDLSEALGKLQSQINAHNKDLKAYETPLKNEAKQVQVGSYSVTIQNVISAGIIRPIIIEGPFKGLFLDEMVSSTGKVLGSNAEASPILMSTKDIISQVKEVQTKEVLLETESPVLNVLKDAPESNLAYSPYTIYSKELANIQNEIKKELPSEPLTKSQINNILGRDMAYKVAENSATTRVESVFRKVKPDEPNEIKFEHNIKTLTPFDQAPIRSLMRSVIFKNGKPDRIKNELFITSTGIKSGLGTRVFLQQVKGASQAKFKTIETYAGRNEDMVGYYVWPKFGYDGKITEQGEELSTDNYDTDFISKIKNLRDRKYLDKLQQVKEWFDKTLGQKIEDHKYSINILDLYACKVNGHFVGQELWKQFGYSIELKFNLKQSSLSMRILNSYLEKKSAEEGVPEEEFLQIDYSKYNNIYNTDEGFSKELYYLHNLEYKVPGDPNPFRKAPARLTPNAIYEIRERLIKGLNLAIANFKPHTVVDDLTEKRYLLKRPKFLDYIFKYPEIMNKFKQFNMPQSFYHTLISFAKQHNAGTPALYRELLAPPIKKASPKSVEAIANDMDISTSLILDEVWSEINILFEKGLVR
jgi:hypothetical protein